MSQQEYTLRWVMLILGFLVIAGGLALKWRKPSIEVFPVLLVVVGTAFVVVGSNGAE